MGGYRTFFILFTSILICFSGYRIYQIEQIRRETKEDLIEISKIKYGFFNVDRWEEIIADILSKKLEEIDFRPEQREVMRDKISAFLLQTIQDFENRYYEEKTQSVIGLLQSGVTYLTGAFEKIKKDIPIFTEQILSFLSNEENREKIKGFLIEKLGEYKENTFSSVDYRLYDEVLLKYGFENGDSGVPGLESRLKALQDEEWTFTIILFAAVLIMALWLVFSNTLSNLDLTLLIGISIVLLLLGVLLPMIEIDARIREIEFSIIGETVHFQNQVLYFRSKSIIEVIILMLLQPGWDIKTVGFLVLLFSVLFPVSKMFASLLTIYRPQTLSSGFIKFLVFKTGKWSMADVMVIAIFMSYIGFSGVLTEQLNQIESLSQSIDIVTTNESSLQKGFFLFTAFAITGLLLVQNLEKRRTGLQSKP